MYKHILLPTDGSTLSLKAVKQGLRFAKSIGAAVTAVYSSPGVPIEFFEYGAAVPESVLQAEERRIRQLAERYLAAVAKLAKAAEVRCDCVVVEQRVPYQAIIETAKKRRCDLIFMASHGRRGIKGLLLGSETTKVLTHSKIPVLVCR